MDGGYTYIQFNNSVTKTIKRELISIQIIIVNNNNSNNNSQIIIVVVRAIQ